MKKPRYYGECSCGWRVAIRKDPRASERMVNMHLQRRVEKKKEDPALHEARVVTIERAE